MLLNIENLAHREFWEKAGVSLPSADIPAMAEKTKKEPIWLHFGAGNIFRGYIASLQQKLINAGLADKGIIAAETFDHEIIDKIYTPYDNLVLNVILNSDATTSLAVTASVAEALTADKQNRLAEIAAYPGLQMISFTITEKGYALRGTDGRLFPAVEADMANGPIQKLTANGQPQELAEYNPPQALAANGQSRLLHAMSITAGLLYKRWLTGGEPIALVSLDNCSKNGDKLKASVMEIAQAWLSNGLAEEDFITWLTDESKVSFPWSMIDKITPSPAKTVASMLADLNIEKMEPVITGKSTYIAPFVNAERPEYLVIEDKFSNSRPRLEKAGVYFTDKDTVNKVERMKVTACLNPLHSAMAPYGCLLGYNLISEMMKDADIVDLVKRVGYAEGLPVVDDPGILSPKAFIDEVVNERLPNPFLPDSPWRIVVDHSQKVSIRFGETIKSYIHKNLDLNSLTAIPLAIAGWLRYLLAVDDSGNEIKLSADPLLGELREQLKDVVWNEPKSHTGQIMGILKNPVIFGLDLTETVLAAKTEEMFTAQLNGVGAVRRTLHEEVAR